MVIHDDQDTADLGPLGHRLGNYFFIVIIIIMSMDYCKLLVILMFIMIVMFIF